MHGEHILLAAVQLVEDARDRDMSCLGGHQLDAEREPVDESTQLLDRSHLVSVQRIGRCVEACQEQPHRFGMRSFPGLAIGEFHGAKLEEVLARDAQRRSTGGEDRDVGCVLEEVLDDVAERVGEVFGSVEHEQHRATVERSLQPVDHAGPLHAVGRPRQRGGRPR